MTWDEMRELKKDWDSYGGEPPSEHAIMRAKEFVETIEFQDVRKGNA